MSHHEGIVYEQQNRMCPMDSLPKLWQKTQTKVHEDTVVHNFPLYCPKCKTEARVDITQLKMTVNK